jgi:photosystem II stability/assembly factor-like uncharacterized protein
MLAAMSRLRRGVPVRSLRACGLILSVLVAAGMAAGATPSKAVGPSWQAPFVLQAGVGLSEQYGYAPSYTRNVPSFDASDRAYIRSRTSNGAATSYIHTLIGGRWTRLDFEAALRAAYPDFVGTVGAGGLRSERIVFDRQDRTYNPITVRLADDSTRNVLMVSWDHCRSWKVFELPAGDFTVEHWVGHNQIDGPPFLAFWRPSQLPQDTHRSQRFSLWVTKPRLEGQQLVIPRPALVTDECLGLSKDSGGASFAVTHGALTWFVWSEATARGSAGVPTFVATYDHATGMASAPQLLAVTRPANDPHNKPGICIDSRGFLHVVAGTHGTAVPYTHSLAPYAVDQGWAPLEPVLDDGYVVDVASGEQVGQQTYNAFVCDSADTLHLITRQWRSGVDQYHPGQSYGALVHQSRPAGGVWGEPTLVVVAADSGYCIYFHKLAIDHRDRLFLSCSYNGGAEIRVAKARSAGLAVLGRKETTLGKYRRRMLLVSCDGGVSWRFAVDADLAAPDEVTSVHSAHLDRPALLRGPGHDAAPSDWRWSNPQPQGNQLTAVGCVDGGRGWVVGTHGTVLRTADGGATWEDQNPGIGGDLYDLAAVDARTAWVVGEAGTVLSTRDGGLHWRLRDVHSTETLLAVRAISRRRILVTGSRGTIRVTKDGGRTWSRQYPKSRENLFSVAFPDASHGWIGAGNGLILATTDGGRVWRAQLTYSRADFYGIAFSDRRHGIAVGSAGTVLRTEDGGCTWSHVESGVSSQLGAVAYSSASVARAVGAGGVVLTTRDGGRSWARGRLPTTSMYGALSVGPKGQLWAAGAAGVVCRGDGGGHSWRRLTRGLTAPLYCATVMGAGLWVAGSDGLLARSAGAGSVWTRFDLNSTAAVRSVAFSGSEVWAVGDGGLVARSADGGVTWARRLIPQHADVKGVAALGPGRAWVAGCDGALLATRDGGVSWHAVPGVSEDLHCVTFHDVARGWAGGGAPYGEGPAVVLRTEDGGTTWKSATTPIWGRIRGLFFIDADTGWAAAEDWGADGDAPQGVVLVTRDGGRTWTVQATTSAALTSVLMRDATHGWAVGGGGTVLATDDGGISWTPQVSGTDDQLNAVVPMGAAGCIVVGDDGALLVATDAVTAAERLP